MYVRMSDFQYCLFFKGRYVVCLRAFKLLIYLIALQSYARLSRTQFITPQKIMDFSNENLRFYIFTAWKQGTRALQILRDLKSVYGAKCTTHKTILKWIGKFKRGQTELKDKVRCGRPNVTVNERNIARVEKAIRDSPNITIRALATMLGLSTKGIHTIIHNHLGLRKVCAKWVPHKLSAEQKAKRVRICTELLAEYGENGAKRVTDIITGDESWFYYYGIPNKLKNMQWIADGESRPTILRPSFRSRKRMVTPFFMHSGPIFVDMLPTKQTFTSKHYVEKVLPKVVEQLRKRYGARGISRIVLLHDNASPHTSKLTRDYLESQKIKVLAHPPYSPDLAPCDFWLFPLVKNKLAGRKFARPENLARAIGAVLKSIPQKDYRKCFSDWIERLNRCVSAGGEYFEGM